MSEETNYVPSFLDPTTILGGMTSCERLEDDFWKVLMHPEDRQAIRSMESLPILPIVCRFIQDKGFERIARAKLIGDAIRLGPNQMPRIYHLLTDVCEALRMKEVPEFYLRMDRFPNADTQGDSHPLISITSGMLEMFSEDDIRIVLAHECGHVLFKHLRYMTVARVLYMCAHSTIGSLANIAGFGSLTALEQCIYRWERMAEYSADRVSLLFAGNLKNAVRVELLLASGLREVPDEINIDEYVKQSEDFVRIFKPDNIEGWISNLTLASKTHPYTSSRCIELAAFSKQSDFKAAAQRLGTYCCPHCGGKMRSMTMCENGHFC